MTKAPAAVQYPRGLGAMPAFVWTMKKTPKLALSNPNTP